MAHSRNLSVFYACSGWCFSLSPRPLWCSENLCVGGWVSIRLLELECNLYKRKGPTRWWWWWFWLDVRLMMIVVIWCYTMCLSTPTHTNASSHELYMRFITRHRNNNSKSKLMWCRRVLWESKPEKYFQTIKERSKNNNNKIICSIQCIAETKNCLTTIPRFNQPNKIARKKIAFENLSDVTEFNIRQLIKVDTVLLWDICFTLYSLFAQTVLAKMLRRTH